MPFANGLAISHIRLFTAIKNSVFLDDGGVKRYKRIFTHFDRPGKLRSPNGDLNLDVTIGDLPAIEIAPRTVSTKAIANQLWNLTETFEIRVWTAEHSSTPAEDFFSRIVATLYQGYDYTEADGLTYRLAQQEFEASISEGNLSNGPAVTVLSFPVTVNANGWNPKTQQP